MYIRFGTLGWPINKGDDEIKTEIADRRRMLRWICGKTGLDKIRRDYVYKREFESLMENGYVERMKNDRTVKIW